MVGGHGTTTKMILCDFLVMCDSLRLIKSGEQKCFSLHKDLGLYSNATISIMLPGQEDSCGDGQVWVDGPGDSVATGRYVKAALTKGGRPWDDHKHYSLSYKRSCAIYLGLFRVGNKNAFYYISTKVCILVPLLK